VVQHVALHPDRLIGFMCIDATQSGELEELDRCYCDLGFRGTKLSPVYQGFHPQDE
jgi:predicted TIM-barrel fold metal-dependent hydrolase